MTLRLVTDNPEPSDEPDFENIPAMLRRYATEIEAGKHGEVDRVVLIAQHNEGLFISTCGEETSSFEIIGICEAAKFRVIADDLVED